MKRRILNLLTLLLLISATIQAQPFSDEEFNDDNIVIKGNVQDKSTGEPLEFATVSLLSAADSSLVANAKDSALTVKANSTFYLKILER